MKIVRVKLSPEAEEVYKHLNEEAPTSKTERMILKAVSKKSHRSRAAGHSYPEFMGFLLPEMEIECRSRATGYGPISRESKSRAD